MTNRRCLHIGALAAAGLAVVVGAFLLDQPLTGVVPKTLGSGDLDRELEAFGQWGQAGATVLLIVILVRVQPRRWRRSLDLALAMGVVAVVVQLLKATIGRVRPKHDDAVSFDGWLLSVGDIPEGLSHYDLSSMPSGHTAAAVVFSAFIAILWPRLCGVAIVMACIVAFSRVSFSAHWVADVCAGALLGFVIGVPMIRCNAGIRLIDWIWRVAVDRKATPALPAVKAYEASLRD